MPSQLSSCTCTMRPKVIRPTRASGGSRLRDICSDSFSACRSSSSRQISTTYRKIKGVGGPRYREPKKQVAFTITSKERNLHHQQVRMMQRIYWPLPRLYLANGTINGLMTTNMLQDYLNSILIKTHMRIHLYYVLNCRELRHQFRRLIHIRDACIRGWKLKDGK